MKFLKKRKTLKITISIVLVLITFTFFVFDNILTGIVKSELKLQFNQNPESLYEINFKSVSHNIFNRSISIDEINIEPRKNAYDSLAAGKLNTLVSTQINSIQLKQFKIINFIRNNIINIKGLSFKDIETIYLSNPKSIKSEKAKKMMMHHIFSDQFKGIDINELEITNASFIFANFDTPDKPSFVLDSVSLKIHDIIINASTLEQAIPVSFSDIELKSNVITIDNLDNYKLTSSGIRFSLIDSTISINDFRLLPKYTKDEFNRRLKYENDIFSFAIDEIKFNGLDINEIKTKELIALNSINISNPKIEIYRDKRVKDRPYKYKPLIASLIKKIPINVKIDTINVENARLEYLEIGKKGNQPGSVIFDPLDISINKLTNIPEIIALHPVLKADIKGKLMGESDLEVKLQFYMKSKKDHFIVDGKLGAIKAASLNPATENLLQVKITSGDIHKVNFYFTADDNSSLGKMEMIYNNLKVEVLKEKKGKEKQSGALSFLANNIIRTKNLKEQAKYKEGIIYFDRIKNKALPNYLWKSLQSGLVSIIAPVAESKKQK